VPGPRPVSAFSFVFACATPFAAFGVLAAMTLSRADAIRATVALWMANQVIGSTRPPSAASMHSIALASPSASAGH